MGFNSNAKITIMSAVESVDELGNTVDGELEIGKVVYAELRKLADPKELVFGSINIPNIYNVKVRRSTFPDSFVEFLWNNVRLIPLTRVDDVRFINFTCRSGS